MKDIPQDATAVAEEDSVLVIESTWPNPPQPHLDVLSAVTVLTPATSFSRFLELPQGIQLQIWKDAAHPIKASWDENFLTLIEWHGGG